MIKKILSRILSSTLVLISYLLSFFNASADDLYIVGGVNKGLSGSESFGGSGGFGGDDGALFFKPYAEGMLTGIVSLNQGYDTLIDYGMFEAKSSLDSGALSAFAATNGGSSKYNTGSHIDVDGFSFVGGVAKGFNLSNGNTLVAAAFAEAGLGDFDTFNSFNNAPSVYGGGDTEYYGGGVMGSYELASGIYTEASVRAGYTETDFSSANINGQPASYDTDSLYYGAAGGAGYRHQLKPNWELNSYAKLIWTHQEGDKIAVNSNRIKFDDIDSLRSRLGMRLSYYQPCSYYSPYIGAAWEHEYKGKAEIRVNGIKEDSPTLKGDTGIFEAGVMMNTPLKGLTFDVGGQGYVGLRKGWTAHLSLRKVF
ncbi:MAG: autotransporter outer membrane beta-barrel domain-containing protein [Lactobacillaceae bacterium]|jgi:hypothetical protein|nr:autotransporter outer membrane beta-barrel domain-containing protein [Lactobacillaceae bacterium]